MSLRFALDQTRDPRLERAEQLSLEALDDAVEDARDDRFAAIDAAEISDLNHDARMATINSQYHRAVAIAHETHEARLDEFRRTVLHEEPRNPMGRLIPQGQTHLEHAREWLAFHMQEILDAKRDLKARPPVDRESWYMSGGVRERYLDRLAREAAARDGLELAF